MENHKESEGIIFVEKFDWFISMLREGKTVTINPYDYGDFLRYVKYHELEKEFSTMQCVEREIDDEAFPIVLNLELAC